MFTKLTIAATALLTTQISAECSTDYYASCGSVDDCCAPLQCLNGGDPYHCQLDCFTENGCEKWEDTYGPMYCADLSVYGGFCRQRAAVEL